MSFLYASKKLQGITNLFQLYTETTQLYLLIYTSFIDQFIPFNTNGQISGFIHPAPFYKGIRNKFLCGQQCIVQITLAQRRS
ncbi:hypothetical protein D3C85_785110 [compost metagenome]